MGKEVENAGFLPVMLAESLVIEENIYKLTFRSQLVNPLAYLSAVSGHSIQLLFENLNAISSLRTKFLGAEP
jgi:hypothetical protein